MRHNDQYSHLLNGMKTPISLKRKITNVVILPAMTYGSENMEKLMFVVGRKIKDEMNR